MKKRSPGCTCCDEVTDCETTCWFPCVGATCPEVCGLIINITTPDDVDVVNEGTLEGDPPVVVDCVVLDPDCPTSAPCVACYEIFDRFIPLARQAVGDCDNYTITKQIGGRSIIECWRPSNYFCPIDTDFPNDVFCLESELYIENPTLELTNVFDGVCGTTTLTIRYDIFRAECGTPTVLARTSYEHVFENEYCTCAEVFDNFVHVSTTATNNSRGITLDDPCNLQLATIKLTDECNRCSCFECNDYDGTFLLSIAGPDFTGTITLDLNAENLGACVAYGTFEVNCPTPTTLYVAVSVVCDTCESYDLTIQILDGPVGIGTTLASGTLENYTCGGGGTFTMNSTPGSPCGINNYTFSVP